MARSLPELSPRPALRRTAQAPHSGNILLDRTKRRGQEVTRPALPSLGDKGSRVDQHIALAWQSQHGQIGPVVIGGDGPLEPRAIHEELPELNPDCQSARLNSVFPTRWRTRPPRMTAVVGTVGSALGW
jgi:hypothetical protein